MLPQLSCLSVRNRPVRRLRLRPSPRYLRISPLHLEFPSPLRSSSPAVSSALPRLSRGLSHLTDQAACAPFMPSDTEQHSHLPSYRGCWHGISRCFFTGSSWARGVRPHTFGDPRKEFTTREPSSSTRRRFVTLSRIAKYSELQPPVGVRAVSQSRCGRSPSQAGYPSSPW